MTNELPPQSPQDIKPISVVEEMKRSYLDYAMSVIVSRALPDVRDGLKPVHRRILYAMHEGGYHANRPYRKSARIVGDVMGNYHPHGDSAIYDAMVRMAQKFSMRLPLIDGQGNFGSMDGDPPAAMRYTEARLSKAAHELLQDIEKDTVNFQPNYDDSQKEPTVLPAKFPNLLVNGSGGIAVGMATNIPPHNLGEVVDAAIALIENEATSDEELLSIIPGPDFPTGGVILGRRGAREAFLTGHGSVIMRGKTHIENISKDREAIIVTEIPYQVNKARMMEKIAELVKEKTIEGISDLRDESDKDGVRVVIELKRDASSDVILNLLYKFSPLQTSFGVNLLALDQGQPLQMGTRHVLKAFLKFREEVITRRTLFELRKAQERAHVLVGLVLSVIHIDPVIELIKSAQNPNEAMQLLMNRDWPARDMADVIRLVEGEAEDATSIDVYRLSERQARAILELRLQRLTGLEREKLSAELHEVVALIKELLALLGSRELLLNVLKEELLYVKAQFATPRLTQFDENEFETDIEDLIMREDMVVTVTQNGYVKRVPVSTYRAQKRGGRGRAGMSTREEDFVSQVLVVNTHTPVLFFSSKGKVYKLKTYKLPIGTPQARGKAFINIFPLEQNETITALMPLPEDDQLCDASYIMFATQSGYVRRNRLSDFVNVMANGKIAMKLEGDDQLIAVLPAQENEDVLLALKSGKCVRFPVPAIRVFSGRSSIGVRGVKLASSKDCVISMSILGHVDALTEERDAYLKAASNHKREANPEFTSEESIALVRYQEMLQAEQFILTITENGFGKRSSAYEYRVTNRGGSGIVNIDTSKRNGQVVASFPVESDDHILLVTNKGQLIRCPVHDIRIAGRATQGVTLFRTLEDEQVVSVTCIPPEENEENGEGEDEEMDVLTHEA